MESKESYIEGKLAQVDDETIREIYKHYFERSTYGMSKVVDVFGEQIRTSSAEDFVNAKNELDVIALLTGHEVIEGLFTRMFHSRNIIAGKKIVRFRKERDKALTKFVWDQAAVFSNNSTYNQTQHMKLVANVIFAVSFTCLSAMGLIPDGLDIKKFQSGGKIG